MTDRFTLHETFELHEVAAVKAVSLTKVKTMRALVTDQRLQELMNEDVALSTRQLQELNGLLTKVTGEGANA